MVAVAGREDLLTPAVASSCTVLIAAASALPSLRERAGAEGVELLAFTDVETLRALDAITSRRPAIVALDRLFAATPRGAALINRIKADPALAHSEIRVISPDRNAVAVPAAVVAPPAPPAADVAPPAPAPAPAAQAPPASGASTEAAPAATDALDEHGTRRNQRTAIAGLPDIAVDGAAASLIDLNASGAQVLSPGVLKPNQRVRVTLSDAKGTVRINGTVVWATFEIPPGIGPRYRAGIEFSDPDIKAIAEYCRRQGQ